MGCTKCTHQNWNVDDELPNGDNNNFNQNPVINPDLGTASSANFPSQGKKKSVADPSIYGFDDTYLDNLWPVDSGVC
jgi:hypothetical protein